VHIGRARQVGVAILLRLAPEPRIDPLEQRQLRFLLDCRGRAAATRSGAIIGVFQLSQHLRRHRVQLSKQAVVEIPLGSIRGTQDVMGHHFSSLVGRLPGIAIVRRTR
jgi:hypothetical protein